MNQSLQALSAAYLAAKAGLRARLPDLTDEVLESVAKALVSEVPKTPELVQKGTVKVKRGRGRPRKLDKTPVPKVFTADKKTKLFGEVARITEDKALPARDIHAQLVKRGFHVYLPYLGVLLSGASGSKGQFDRTKDGAIYLYRAKKKAALTQKTA